MTETQSVLKFHHFRYRMFVSALKALWYNHLMTSRRECVDAFVSTYCQGRYLKGHRGFFEGMALKIPPIF